MKIKSIHLENIKSYVNETFDFQEGINCILGLNGSGKSTLIESIGIAIFNFNRYANLSQMIRYGQSKGIIEVVFEANDERDYQIIRVIRPKSNTVKIIDCTNQEELYSGTSEVYHFIKNVLKVSRTKEFSKMFEEIIAVPQGQFVNAFLENPAKRKENFDKLFDLHIYKDLNGKTKELLDYVKETRTVPLEKEIAHLTGEISLLDDKKQAKGLLEKEISEIEGHLTESQNQFNTTKTAKEELEQIQKDMEQKQTEVTLTKEKINHYTQKENELKQTIILDEKAVALVEQSKKGYMKYQETQRNLVTYEEKQEQYQVLEKEMQQKEASIRVYDANLNHYEELKKQALQIIQDKQDELARLNQEIVVLEGNIVAYKEQEEQASNDFQSDKEKLNQEKEQLLSMLQRVRDFETRNLHIDHFPAEAIEGIVQIQEEKNKELQENQSKKQQLHQLEKQKIQYQIEIDSAIANSQLTVDGTCPFLKEKCKNIKEGSLNLYFEKRVATYNALLEEVTTQLEQIKKEVLDEKEVAIELERLDNKKSLVLESRKKEQNLQKDILSWFEENELQMDEKKDPLNQAKEYIEMQLNENSQKQTIHEETRTEIVDIQSKKNTSVFQLTNHQTQLKQLQTEIHKAKKQQEDNQNKIYFDQKRKDAEIAAISDIQKTLEQDKNTKAIIDQLKKQLVELEQEKTMYLENIGRSKEYSKTKKMLDQTLQEKQNEEKKLDQTAQLLTDLTNRFNLEKLEELKQVYQELIAKISALKTTAFEKKQQNKALEKEIEEMEAKQNLLNQKQNEANHYSRIRDFFEKMRKIYTNLPMQLSQSYREYISTLATGIYRRISKENVRLVIKEDYLVQLIDDGKENNIKEIDQLSGGEQMSVAIAIRLSMLRQLSGLDIYFLDEPTINLDYERRSRIASVIQDIAGELSQLFVISHDDTFDDITQSIIKIEKENNISHLER
ncbi:MAG: SMC family ATPase [Bacilli bacterium]|jgi:exonuclease SbcC|nr:SMC family ATPase [Bacilli bacterium]